MSTSPPPPTPQPRLPAPGKAQARIALALQLVLIAALLGLIYWVVNHALEVLRARGVRSGFDFLQDAAGIPISEGWPSYSPEQPFWRAFLTGVGNTVRAAVPAAILAVLIGVVLGVGRLVPHRLVSGLCAAYINLVRNVPLLLQLLMVAFAIGALLPDPTEPWQLMPGVWLSKAGLSVPWPVHGESGWLLEWPEQNNFGVMGGAALSPEYVAIVAALARTTPGTCVTPTCKTTWSSRVRSPCAACRSICARWTCRRTSMARAKTTSCPLAVLTPPPRC